MNERITDPERARDYVRGILDQMFREVEDAVADDYREARRIEPYGVDEADIQLAIFKAVRNWLPRPSQEDQR